MQCFLFQSRRTQRALHRQDVQKLEAMMMPLAADRNERATGGGRVSPIDIATLSTRSEPRRARHRMAARHDLGQPWQASRMLESQMAAGQNASRQLRCVGMQGSPLCQAFAP